MDSKIITISREFGSGGRSIGKSLAEKLGLHYYDKELIKSISVKSGFAPEYIEEKSEYAEGKTPLSYYLAPGMPGVMRGLSAAEYLWVIQREVILELAQKEPCVIIGRCADYILKDRADCLHVFVHADLPYRAERIVQLYGETDKKPEKRLEEKDARRKVNYKHFTNREWGMAQNYHLTLNSGVIGMESCVDLIADLCRSGK